MQEEGRCQLCEVIPEHHPQASASVAATPLTTRRQHRHHAQQSQPIYGTHTSRREKAPPACEHKHRLSPGLSQGLSPGLSQGLSQGLSNDCHVRGSNYRYSPRHTISEDPTFIQELSSYMRKSRNNYDGEPNQNLNIQNLNYPQEEHHLDYAREPYSKMNNLPRIPHRSSRSGSYNNQILNPKALNVPNGHLPASNRSNTLPTNILSRGHGSKISTLQDVDQDYFFNLQRSRFSFDGSKREARKQRMTIQHVVLIGCFALMFVVGIIMFVAVCYQNGWLGLGRSNSHYDNIARRENENLRRIHKPIGNFPNTLQRQRTTAPVRARNDYPRIGITGRRQHPSQYEDRVYQPSPQFARLVDDGAARDHQGIRHTSPNIANNHVNHLPIPASLVDNREISTINNGVYNERYPQENMQTVQSTFSNEGTATHNEGFSEDIQPGFNGMIYNYASEDHISQDRLINTHIPDYHDTQPYIDERSEVFSTSNDNHHQENVQQIQSSFRNEGTVTDEGEWNLGFSDNNQSVYNGMSPNLNSEDHIAQGSMLDDHIPDTHDAQPTIDEQIEVTTDIVPKKFIKKLILFLA
ncbi:unnamed protein product [Meganyctiphanes norvegica]|uniref:Uncharacterized protein n=1 Tax=Meganyctiphanes norvegica TaxID=48144 RepID=A0AAV2QY29_MEGNR